GCNEKVLLHQNNCPADNCHASVIAVASERRFSVTSLQSTMDVDEVDVDPASIEHPKRTKEPATNPPSNKKAKQAKNEDSPVLKKTYTGATMEEHEAQRQVNDEVRDQLPKNNENYALKENRAGAKNL
ncbi:5349_t:CDS:2, partial [Rhizophagus irregularis]